MPVSITATLAVLASWTAVLLPAPMRRTPVGTSSPAAGGVLAPARIRPMDELRSQYYLTMDVLDRPGVLEQVAGAMARHGVSILKMEQLGLGAEARLVLVTHTASERAVQATLAELGRLEVVDRTGTLLRVVGHEE